MRTNPIAKSTGAKRIDEESQTLVGIGNEQLFLQVESDRACCQVRKTGSRACQENVQGSPIPEIEKQLRRALPFACSDERTESSSEVSGEMRSNVEQSTALAERRV